MKKSILLILSIIGLSFIPISYAGDKDDARYEVTIKVVYNAVSAEEAAKIMRDVGKQHDGACKVEVFRKKLGDDRGDEDTAVFSDSISQDEIYDNILHDNNGGFLYDCGKYWGPRPCENQ